MDLQGVVIRQAVPGDSLEVRRFVFEVTRFYGFEPDPEGLDADVMHYGESTDGSTQQWVAELNAAVVGSIALTSGEECVAYLATFFVDLRCQGRGIGRALLEHVIKTAKLKGYRRIDLETRHIYRRAIHLYESLGWIRGTDLPAEDVMDRRYSLNL